MKKLNALFILILLSTLSYGQGSWVNVSNSLQRKIVGADTLYRFNMGAPGFWNISDKFGQYYTKVQSDARYALAGAAGVSSFNGRTGAITPLVGDYSAFFPVLTGSYINPSWITSIPYSKITDAPTYKDSLSATSPIFYNSSTGVISSQAAGSGVSGYVTSGVQTFSGLKTFSSDLTLSNSAALRMMNGSIEFHNSTTGFTNYVNGISSTAGRSWTFPNASGTLALTSDLTSYVPTSRTVAGFPLSSNVTLASITAGYGLSGSSFNGSTARTWTSDTTSATGLVSKDRLNTALASKVTANTSITGATKAKITYDSKGLVTAGADLTESDIPSLPISKVTGLQDSLTARLLKAYQFGVTGEEFGAVGNGVTDDTDAFLDAIATGKNIILLDNKTYKITSSLSLNDYQSITGGKSSIISFGNHSAIIPGKFSSVSNIQFDGSGKTSGETLQVGVFIRSKEGVQVSDVLFNDIGGYAIYADSLRADELRGNLIKGVRIRNSKTGVKLGYMAEYSELTNVSVIGSDTAIVFLGGNNKMIGGELVNNSIGIYISSDGVNDGHSQCVGTTFNHNTTNIYTNNVTYGYVFSGISAQAGDIKIVNSPFISIENSILAVDSIINQNSPSFKIANTFIRGIIPVVSETGTASHIFINNVTDSDFPDYLKEYYGHYAPANSVLGNSSSGRTLPSYQTSINVSGSVTSGSVVSGSATLSSVSVTGDSNTGLNLASFRNTNAGTSAVTRVFYGNNNIPHAFTIDVYGSNYPSLGNHVVLTNQTNAPLKLGGYGDTQLTLGNTSATFTVPVIMPTGSTAVTPTAGDNSTKVATTAYVDAAVSGGSTFLRDAINNTNAAYGSFPTANTTKLVAFTAMTGNRTVDIPAGNATNASTNILIIKDESGSGSTYTITITPASGTIDGAANKVINTAYGVVELYSNGSNWFTK